MKTIVIGTSGYIGQSLWQSHQKEGGHLPLLDYKNEPKVRLEAPQFDQLPFNFPEYRWAIIASAVPKLGFCETEREFTSRCNVSGTLQLVEQIRKKGLIPVVFSSDYVFDGLVGGYVEESKIHPLNEYGKQKAKVEQELPRICGSEYLLIRLSKVVGRDLKDKTLLSEIIEKLTNGEPVRAAYDQKMSPIFLEDVVQGIRALQKIDARGTYHLCGEEPWIRLELARFIAASLKLDLDLVEPISLDDLGEPFIRPKKTDMSCSKFLKTTGYQMTSIRSHIEKLAGSFCCKFQN